MRTFDKLGKKKIVIGMVHLLPLPGTPFYQEGNVERALTKAVADATALYHGGADIKLIAEVNSMHFRWLGDKSTAEVARMAVRVGADAVEVAHPDEETNACLVREVKQAMPHLPVILGGHTNHANVARRLAEADGAFVGTCLQGDGWGGRIDIERVREYVKIVAGLQ